MTSECALVDTPHLTTGGWVALCQKEKHRRLLIGNAFSTVQTSKALHTFLREHQNARLIFVYDFWRFINFID